MNPSGEILVCGMRFQIDAPVVNYVDNPSFNAYQPRCYHGPRGGPVVGDGVHPFAPAKGMASVVNRYRLRRLTGGMREGNGALSRLKQVMRQFVLHHDGCNTSAECFHVLHDERGLSVHFLLDNDGTLYQTLDLVDCAYHAGGGVNEFSIGVEICNRGNVSLTGENRYHDRPIKEVTVNGGHHRTWDYTEGQYQTMIKLGQALTKIFPNLPQVSPEISGDPLLTWLQNPVMFSGYLGHYHITNQKWDPGSFDFKRLIQKIRSRMSWFVCIGKSEQACDHGTEIAAEPAALEQQQKDLLGNNEEDAMGGYCPIVPFGRTTRIWHGGIHLSENEGAPVFSPFPGRIVACFNGDDVDIGSRNFVLVQHKFHVGGQNISFYMLYYHLQREQPTETRTPWFAGADKKPFWKDIEAEQVAFPDIDVAAGELLGHVGQAGPDARNLEPQVHVEVLSAEDIGTRLDPAFWKAVDGGEGPYCNVPEIMRILDPARAPRKDARWPGESEVQRFFTPEAHAALRTLAVRFQSEWGKVPDLAARLQRSKDFNGLSASRRNYVLRRQIEPTLWLTREVAERVGLPQDFIVWHYHPVRFVPWLNGQLARAAQDVKVEANKDTAPVQIPDDPHEGEGFIDDGDELSIQSGRNLQLEDLAGGYPDSQ